MVLGVYGAGGFGREFSIIADQINAEKHSWTEIVFIDDGCEDPEVNGRQVLRLEAMDPGISEIVIAVGNPSTREALYRKVKENGFSFASLIHPDVYVADSVQLGEGVVIYDGVHLGDRSVIGDNACLMPHVVIGHDTWIGAHSVIASNSCINGTNRLGDRSYVGFLSGTKENLTIGDDVICAAGAIVFQDLPDDVIVVGNPARIVKKNTERKVFGK